MPADASLLTPDAVDGIVRRIVAEVLMVPPEEVQPGSLLSAELGAESLDYLDLIFRLEETLRVPIPVKRWTEFLAERLAGRDLTTAITVDLVREFAVRQIAR